MEIMPLLMSRLMQRGMVLVEVVAVTEEAEQAVKEETAETEAEVVLMNQTLRVVKEEIKAVKVAEINRVVDIEEADQVKEVKEAEMLEVIKVSLLPVTLEV
tara:strand:+ start:117 stop:419 length:303 start_codon:yes stop_codon:yes gene_type:complete